MTSKIGIADTKKCAMEVGCRDVHRTAVALADRRRRPPANPSGWSIDFSDRSDHDGSVSAVVEGRSIGMLDISRRLLSFVKKTREHEGGGDPRQ
jgi:hypothetical protein